MKIIVIGGTGVIGSAVVSELKQRHEVICVGHSKGDYQVDIADEKSIDALYKKIGKFDALVATTGKVIFDYFQNLDVAKFQVGFNDKLMGQINLVRLGCHHINDGGSFTLTSGILNCDPIRGGAAASTVNGALEGFVRGAAIELSHGLRINLVSPTVITESLKDYAPYFRGFESVPAARVALAYSKSVEGSQTGQIYRVGY